MKKLLTTACLFVVTIVATVTFTAFPVLEAAYSNEEDLCLKKLL